MKCPTRTKAMREGKVWYDYTNAVWMWDWAGYPSPTHFCLGCGCPLPLMGNETATYRLLRRALDEPLGNPEE